MTKWTFCYELGLPSDSNIIIVDRQYHELFIEKDDAILLHQYQHKPNNAKC